MRKYHNQIYVKLSVQERKGLTIGDGKFGNFQKGQNPKANNASQIKLKANNICYLEQNEGTWTF